MIRPFVVASVSLMMALAAQAQPAEAAPSAVALSALVQQGEITCADNVKVRIVSMGGEVPRFHVQLGVKVFYEMTAVPTESGAVRLEDRARGAEWIQLPAKSMLMSSKQGRRLADGCQTPEQARAERMAQNQPNTLLDDDTEVVQYRKPTH